MSRMRQEEENKKEKFTVFLEEIRNIAGIKLIKLTITSHLHIKDIAETQDLNLKLKYCAASNAIGS